jgi:hypothetical protein
MKPAMLFSLMLRDYYTRASLTPSWFLCRINLLGNLVSHQIDTQPTLSFAFLDHQTSHDDPFDARILLYEFILDAF